MNDPEVAKSPDDIPNSRYIRSFDYDYLCTVIWRYNG